jgi:hypothetical protein
VAVLLLLVGGYVAFTQLGGASGATATLSLTTTPAEALVLVDGDTVGTTPVSRHALDAGSVTLRVRKDGYAPLDTTLTATAGERVRLQNVVLTDVASGGTASDATLAENTASQSAAETSTEPTKTDPEPAASQESSSDVSSQTGSDFEAESTTPVESGSRAEATDPAGSEAAAADGAATGLVDVTPGSPGAVTVLIDGNAQSGGQAVPLTEGTHTVTCRHQRHGAIETTVTVSEGQTETLRCYFEHELTVTTQGPWGRIWLNRSDTGQQTPSTLSLSPGTHRIEVRRKTLDQFSVDGGAVRTKRNGESNISQFRGRSYQIQVDPGFTKVEHAISFKTTGG